MVVLLLVSWRMVEMASGVACMCEMTIVMVVIRDIFSPRVMMASMWMLDWRRYWIPSAADKREEHLSELGILSLFRESA